MSRVTINRNPQPFPIPKKRSLQPTSGKLYLKASYKILFNSNILMVIWFLGFEGQGIPPGLHVRIDMQTGKKEAKLLDETEKPVQSSSALIRTVSEEEPEEISTSIDYSVLEEALKKIKNDGGSGSSADSTIYRSYEEIKEEMKKVEQSIKTEYEIVKDLVSSYMKLEEDPEKESILNDLEFYVHQYDNAQDFVMMGGFKNVVLPALNSSSPALRSSAAFLLGNI